MGHLVLEGGGEFVGAMREPDTAALRLAGGTERPVRIIPAAAAPDCNHVRAGANGEAWFRSLGARDVQVVDLIDRTGADAPRTATALAGAGLIYLLGGFPGYLADVLAQSAAWGAVLQALASGGVLAGSSAGAMVLCDRYFDPERKEVRPGLALLRNACILPHHDTFGKDWAPLLQERLPGFALIGIDEQTGLIGSALENRWTVAGRGAVTVYHGPRPVAFRERETLSLPQKPCAGEDQG